VPDSDWYGYDPGDDAQSGPAASWRTWWQALPADAEPMISARRQGFVLPVAELAQLGFTRAARRAAVRRGAWFVPSRGVIAPVQVDDGAAQHLVRRRQHALVASAATLGRRDHIVSARSAAILHGLPTMSVPEWAELTGRMPTGSVGSGRRIRTARRCSVIPSSAGTASW
jgi:hypothetical protein